MLDQVTGEKREESHAAEAKQRAVGEFTAMPLRIREQPDTAEKKCRTDQARSGQCCRHANDNHIVAAKGRFVGGNAGRGDHRGYPRAFRSSGWRSVAMAPPDGFSASVTSPPRLRSAWRATVRPMPTPTVCFELMKGSNA